MTFWVVQVLDLFAPILDSILSHSLCLFPDLLHKLLDVVLQEFNFLVLPCMGFLQPYNTLDQHGLVHLWKAVHYHHSWTRLVLRRTIVYTAASDIKRAWETERKREKDESMSPNTLRKNGNKVSPNAFKWQSHHTGNNNQPHTADGNHSHQEYKTRMLQEVDERHAGWQAKIKKDRNNSYVRRIADNFWIFNKIWFILPALWQCCWNYWKLEIKVYLMNWSDCPCCYPPDRSLHSPPAPASCVLLQRKGQHLKNLLIFLLRISFPGEWEDSLPSQDTCSHHNLKTFN